MGIRQTLNENPVVTSAVVGVLTLGALFLVGRQACGGPNVSSGPTQAFFTVDEGKTFFPDDATKLPPIQKDGKPAYRARVFKCKDGKQFVGYIERYPEAIKARLETEGTNNMVAYQALEVKRPGDKAWVSMANPQAMGKVRGGIRCPDGSPAVAVEPGQ